MGVVVNSPGMASILRVRHRAGFTLFSCVMVRRRGRVTAKPSGLKDTYRFGSTFQIMAATV